MLFHKRSEPTPVEGALARGGIQANTELNCKLARRMKEKRKRVGYFALKAKKRKESEDRKAIRFGLNTAKKTPPEEVDALEDEDESEDEEEDKDEEEELDEEAGNEDGAKKEEWRKDKKGVLTKIR